ncbi:EamA family transporter [Candidatus Babeliales bacterium]|nr:EamA family transporter [Candidatus Babeliales bacterium]
MILVVFLYASLASTFVIAKYVVSHAKPFFTIAFRMLVAGTLLTGYLYIKDRASCRIDRDDYKLFFKVALFHIYLAFIPEFWALQYVSSIKTNMMYSATPFIAAFLSFVLLNETLNARKWFGMFLGVTSLTPLFLIASASQAETSAFFISFPDVVLFCAVCSASYAWFLVKRLMSRGYQLPLINGVAMLGGGFGALITSLVFEGITESPVYAWEPFFKGVFLLILVANLLVYNLYGYLLKKYSITFVSLSGLLCPLFGTLFGWFFLQEPLSWHHALSFVGLSAALYIFQGMDAKQKT